MATDEKSIHISTYDRPLLVDKNDNKGVFEPTTNKHQWNRWRMAINDTLCQRLTSSEHNAGTNVASSEEKLHRASPERKITGVSFRERVVVNKLTHLNVDRMMASDGVPDSRGHLGTGQFVFYGIPRATLRNKDDTSPSGTKFVNVFIPSDIKIRKYRKQTSMKRYLNMIK